MCTAPAQDIIGNLALFYQHAKDLRYIEKTGIAEDMAGMMIAEKGVSTNATAGKTANMMYSQIIHILA